MPGGPLAPHMSARLRTETIDALFIGAGGFDRALAWVNKDDDNYGEFFKMWARGAVRSSNVEVTPGGSVDDIVNQLSASERAKVVGSSVIGDSAVIDVE